MWLSLDQSFNVVDKEHHTIKIKIPRKTHSVYIRTYPDANQNSFNSGNQPHYIMPYGNNV